MYNTHPKSHFVRQQLHALAVLLHPTFPLHLKEETPTVFERTRLIRQFFMAVEARNHHFFPSQVIQDRDFVNRYNIGTASNGQEMLQFPAIPLPAAALPGTNTFRQQMICDSSQQTKNSINTDVTGLTYNLIPAPRKRSREPTDQFLQPAADLKNDCISPIPAFVGEDIILSQIQRYQFEIDAIISQHTKKIRLELQQRQKQQAAMLVAAITGGTAKKLKEKDEQIQSLGKLNLVLQERVKSLYVENELWKDIAQTNEATANSLRANLEQVLAHVGGEDRVCSGAVAGARAEEDAESFCGSSDHGGGAEAAGEAQEMSRRCYGDMRCRKCGERESTVLLLPCRHLCLCSVCVSGSCRLLACPVCNSSMTATLHVNLCS